MGPRSTLKALRATLAHLREDAAVLTTENGGYPSPPTLRARAAINVAIQEVHAAVRQHEERHDAVATPVQPTGKSQELLAASRSFAAATAALEEAKDGPGRHEP
jgi:hypothetical protein